MNARCGDIWPAIARKAWPAWKDRYVLTADSTVSGPTSKRWFERRPRNGRDRHELVFRHEAAASNDMWQSDHTVLDILILDNHGEPARPWLTTVIDDYSRAIAGYFLTLDALSTMNTAWARPGRAFVPHPQ
ncbi:MAG: hypothetical protein PF501_04095 [Salinisphaera sp.]|nr:hypothetical protein [Salinisphaera sp.]